MQAQRGFTYMLVLFLIAFIGAGLGVASDVWVTAKQREHETELLFSGDAIRVAIANYYRGSPGNIKQFPMQLEDLLKDPRYPDTRRYLRQLYTEPFSEKTEWVLIKAPQGGIMGVASPSETLPLKLTGFQGADHVFEDQAVRLKDKLRYRDWEFIYNPAIREPGV
jgi:type II secretory pathway pseudopilin PulG